LFDQTTDLGVPCLMAVISDPPAGRGRYFDTSAGYGCHPVGSRAIARAITEAAQTRVTNIAGARDDFLPLEYVAAPDSSAAFLSGPTKAAMVAPIWLREGTPLPAMLERLETAVGAVADISWARLGGEQFGIAVVRALSGTLEDREANIHWRPGRRALRVLTRQ
jgi:ribosomal protein S12 methylthiotransferase accessory factor